MLAARDRETAIKTMIEMMLSSLRYFFRVEVLVQIGERLKRAL